MNEIASKSLGYLTGAAVSAMVHLGDRLGLYRGLRGAGALTSTELAAKTNLDERWVREWLHGQASAGLIQFAGEGRFELTEEQAAVLADESDAEFLGGAFEILAALTRQSKRIQESFKTGRGTGFDELGVDHLKGEIRFNEPWMRANLTSVIVPGLADLVPKLNRGAKVADIDCRCGGVLLELAKAYPKSEFHGYETAELAYGMAEERLGRAGLRNLMFHRATVEDLGPPASFDFIITWDVVHDMPDPAAAMRAVRRAIKPDGTWLIVDLKCMPTPEENFRHPMGALLYSISVLDCLTLSTCHAKDAALGTLGLSEPAVRKLAAEAGFSRCEVRDFGKPSSAFYEVRP